jgi:hypothetical protein
MFDEKHMQSVLAELNVDPELKPNISPLVVGANPYSSDSRPDMANQLKLAFLNSSRS